MTKNNPIKDFFSKDIHIKIFSLIAAIFAWFVVMNTIEPLETKVFQAPITFENSKDIMEQGYIVSNMDSFNNVNIDVGIEATRSALDDFVRNDAENDLYARVDLSDINIDSEDSFPQTFSLNVVPKLPTYLNSHSYSIISYTPSVVTVEIDKLSSVELGVKVNTTGSPASGYEISGTELSQNTVVVNGPESEIEQAFSVGVNVDVSEVKETRNVTATPVVYDKSGNELSDFVIEPSRINVTVNVAKNGTVTINEPKTTGALPPNLELKSIDWSPKSITLAGPEDKLAEVTNLDVAAVDLSLVSGDTVITRDISQMVKELGLEVKNAKESQIQITVDVELVNPKQITIKDTDIKVIGLPENKSIDLPDKTVVSIAGADTVDVSLLNPTIDVNGLSDGKHSVKLSLTQPNNIAIDNSIVLEVVIKGEDTDSSPLEVESETEDIEE